MYMYIQVFIIYKSTRRNETVSIVRGGTKIPGLSSELVRENKLLPIVFAHPRYARSLARLLDLLA